MEPTHIISMMSSMLHTLFSHKIWWHRRCKNGKCLEWPQHSCLNIYVTVSSRENTVRTWGNFLITHLVTFVIHFSVKTFFLQKFPFNCESNVLSLRNNIRYDFRPREYEFTTKKKFFFLSQGAWLRAFF